MRKYSFFIIFMCIIAGILPVNHTHAQTQEIPSVVVTTNIDTVDPFDNLISLREAVEVYAGNTLDINGVIYDLTDSTTITFDNTIFSAGGLNNTITLDTVAGAITVNQSLTIRGNGMNATILDGNGGTRILYSNGDSLVLSGITFQNGQEYSMGGAVFSESKVVNISSSRFENNKILTGEGGALLCYYDDTLTVNITDCIFEDNLAGIDTAIFYGSGGALSVTGTAEVSEVTIRNSEFNRNIIPNGEGGAIHVYANKLTITGSNFNNNRIDSSGQGGAVWYYGIALNIEGSDFTGNAAVPTNLGDGCFCDGSGGAIYFTICEEPSIPVTPGVRITGNSHFDQNRANFYGGAIYGNFCDGDMIMRDVEFTENNADGSGGAVYLSNFEKLTITNGFFEANVIEVDKDAHESRGGGLFLDGACCDEPSIIDSSYFINNYIHVTGPENLMSGGAIYTSGRLHIKNSVLNGNHVSGAGNSGIFNGGAIFNSSDSLLVLNCTLTDNYISVESDSVMYGGGGAVCNESATMYTVSSVFEDNYAHFTGTGIEYCGGGAIYSPDGIVNAEKTMFTRNYLKIDGSSEELHSGGGAIYQSGSSTGLITKSTFSGNYLEFDGSNQLGLGGGAIFESGSIGIKVIESTLTDNYVKLSAGAEIGGGGAIYMNGKAELANATLTNNRIISASSGEINGGAIFNNAGTLEIINSIVTGNYLGEDPTVPGVAEDIYHGSNIDGDYGQVSIAYTIYGIINGPIDTNLKSLQAGPEEIYNAEWASNGQTYHLIEIDDQRPVFNDTVMRISKDGKAAYSGTLAGLLIDENSFCSYDCNSYLFFLHENYWHTLYDSPVDPDSVIIYDPTNTVNYGLEYSDDYNHYRSSILKIAQNNVNRTQTLVAFNVGAFALDPEDPEVVVNTVEDKINVFDKKITLREAIAYSGNTYNYDRGVYDLTAEKEVTFNDTVFTDNARMVHTIVLDTTLRELIVDKEVDITGRRHSTANYNLITVKVPVTYTESQASATQASDFRVLNILPGARTTISNLYLRGGEVDSAGVVMVKGGMNAALVGVSLSDAKAIYGGGLFALEGPLSLTNVIISNNEAEYLGGGLFLENGPTSIINSTITQNSSSGVGGGLYKRSYNTVNTRNSIIWNNGNFNTSFANENTIYNSLVEGITTNQNQNINGNTDPEFIDAVNRNFNLDENSPVLDMGNNAYITGFPIDFEGKARISGNTVDLGALEFRAANCPPPGFFAMDCPNDTVVTLPYGVCETKIGLSAPVPNWNDEDFTLTSNIPADSIFTAGVYEIKWIAESRICGIRDSCSHWLVVNNALCGLNDTVWILQPNGAPVYELDSLIAVDFNGNRYPTVRIGCDCWTARNLVSTNYADGREVVYTIYYDEAMYPDTAANKEKYGYLYNWANAADNGNTVGQGITRGICPDGWALPSVPDYEKLIPYGSDALRQSNIWLEDNTATNYTGFSAIPSGYYNPSLNKYYFLLGDAYFWTSEPATPTIGKVAHIRYLCPVLQIEDMFKANSVSVRCIKVN